jgi:hypothetical protein
MTMNPDVAHSTGVAPIDYAAPTAPTGAEPITRRDIALIAFRIIAMLTGYNALLSLFQFVVSVASRGSFSVSDSVAAAIMFIFYGGIAFGLWIGAAHLTSLVLRVAWPPSTPQVPVASMSSLLAVDMLAAGVALTGIWLLVFDAVPSLVWQGAIVVMQIRGMGIDSISRTPGLQLLGAGAKLLIGVYLFVRARKLAFRWSQYRSLPVPPEASPL